jgi:transcriptional/translational regulatory protein YebC/TACO1
LFEIASGNGSVAADFQKSTTKRAWKADAPTFVRVPTTTQTLDRDERASVERLLDALDDLDDVETVYTTLADDSETVTA